MGEHRKEIATRHNDGDQTRCNVEPCHDLSQMVWLNVAAPRSGQTMEDTLRASPLPDVTPEFATHLLRFIHHDPQQINAVASISPRVAQLAISFPLLFSVLAYPYGPANLRDDTIAAAVEGVPLRDIARLAGLPYCLRTLPPEACPKNLLYHRWSLEANRQLCPLIPHDDTLDLLWLTALFAAAQRGEEAVAIWMARQYCLPILSRLPLDSWQPLLMFAWYSVHYPAIVHPNGKWSPTIHFRRAVKRCELWLKHLALFTELDIKGVADPWLSELHADGLHIVPITTPQAILDEASAMENCLVDYGVYVAEGICRLFSVREGGHRVATLQLELGSDGRSLTVAEIKGPRNKACSVTIKARVSEIVTACQPRRFSTEFCRPASERCALRNCIEPYRQSRPTYEHDRLAVLTIAKLYGAHDQISRLVRITRPRKFYTAELEPRECTP